jgi:hypothetical protein
MIARIFCVLVVLAAVASAHPMDVGYLRIEQRGSDLAVQMEIDASAAAIVLGSEATRDRVRADAAVLARETYARDPIVTDRGDCTWAAATAERSGTTVRVASVAQCPPSSGSRRWRFAFIPAHRISPTFELLAKHVVDGSERLTLIDRYTPELVFDQASAPGFTHFVWSGVAHIGMAPAEWRTVDGGLELPDGIDHILFVIGLVLAGGTLRRLLGVATGFTAGHSITLALASFGVLHPPGWLIEPVIALSIALVAVDALTDRFARHRFWIALGFGLVHGFGFANALVELELPTRELMTALFGYNLGVELGQLAIVLLVAPPLVLAHRSPRVHAAVVRGLAIVIAVCGVTWFVERLVAAL